MLTSKVGIPAVLKLNGYFLAPRNSSSASGRHIRVDVCYRQKYSSQNSIFIGNLPFSANEEEVRYCFAKLDLFISCCSMLFLSNLGS